jgi:hypothetical protein
MWFKLAAEVGHQDAVGEMNLLEVQFSPKQLEEAEWRYLEIRTNLKSICPTCGSEGRTTDFGFTCEKGHIWNVPKSGKKTSSLEQK